MLIYLPKAGESTTAKIHRSVVEIQTRVSNLLRADLSSTRVELGATRFCEVGRKRCDR
ncbi:MAG: hypothetical protein V7K19_26770 [Nostoc sp.]